MAISQRQVVQECFDEVRERDCSYCSAHHSKGGECCFGHRFEDPDPTGQCQDCIHEPACGPATLTYERRAERPRRPIRRTPGTTSRLPVYSQGKDRGNLLDDHSPARTPATKKNTQVEAVVYETSSEDGRVQRFFKQMGLHALWGAGEGSLEMVLGFMRNRRPD